MKLLKPIKQATDCNTIKDCDMALSNLEKVAKKNKGYTPVMTRRKKSLQKRKFRLVIEAYDLNLA